MVQTFAASRVCRVPWNAAFLSSSYRYKLRIPFSTKKLMKKRLDPATRQKYPILSVYSIRNERDFRVFHFSPCRSQPTERSGILFLIFSAMMDKCPRRNHVFDVASGENSVASRNRSEKKEIRTFSSAEFESNFAVKIRGNNWREIFHFCRARRTAHERNRVVETIVLFASARILIDISSREIERAELLRAQYFSSLIHLAELKDIASATWMKGLCTPF